MRTFVGLIVLLATTAATAEPVGCTTVEKALTDINKRFGEKPMFIATQGGWVLTFTLNEKTGTWTVFGQRSPDLMCPISAGENWQAAPAAVQHLGDQPT